MHGATEEIINAVLPLKSADGLEPLEWTATPAFIHNDHRYTLAICRAAQERQRLKTPTNLVVFDFHSDYSDIDPEWRQELRGRTLPDANAVMEICRSAAPENSKSVSHRDDDWIKAGMELGLIQDVVSFGVVQNSYKFKETYTDAGGRTHNTWFLSLPSYELSSRGRLRDEARRAEYEAIWKCLDWDPQAGDFGRQHSPYLLSFDLDCFSYSLGAGVFFAWPERAFANEFLADHAASKRFVTALATHAGVVDVAREPAHCGSTGDAEAILLRLDAYVFDGELNFE